MDVAGGQKVNPISTRVADYTHHSTMSPPEFQTYAGKIPPPHCICEFENIYVSSFTVEEAEAVIFKLINIHIYQA